MQQEEARVGRADVNASVSSRLGIQLVVESFGSGWR
jgi:hypothetical protein